MVHPDSLDSLSAKVTATNNAHAYALKLYPVLAEFFAGYVGQKIERSDGNLLKKIQDALPQFPDSGLPQHQLNVFRHTSDYSLAWTIVAFELSPSQHGNCDYYKVTVYVGNMRNGVLESLQDAPTLRADYTVEEVQQYRQDLQKAIESYNAVQVAWSALWPFDEQDG